MKKINQNLHESLLVLLLYHEFNLDMGYGMLINEVVPRIWGHDKSIFKNLNSLVFPEKNRVYL